MTFDTAGLRPETIDHLRELQRIRAAAGAPEMSIAELAELLIEKLRESAGKH